MCFPYGLGQPKVGLHDLLERMAAAVAAHVAEDNRRTKREAAKEQT